MFCNAGASYVCTIYARPEYDEYMQHKHKYVIVLHPLTCSNHHCVLMHELIYISYIYRILDTSGFVDFT